MTAGKEIFSSNLFKRDFVGIDFHPHELILGVATAEETVFLDLQTFRVVGESHFPSSPQLLVKYSAPEMPLCLVSGCQDGLLVHSSEGDILKSTHNIPCPFAEVADVQWVPNLNYLLTVMGDGLTIHSSLFDLTVLTVSFSAINVITRIVFVSLYLADQGHRHHIAPGLQIFIPRKRVTIL